MKSNPPLQAAAHDHAIHEESKAFNEAETKRRVTAFMNQVR